MWVLGLFYNNLKNINNVVSLTTENSICPFHLSGHIRKGKMGLSSHENYSSHHHCLKSCFGNPTFKFRNKRMNICSEGSVVYWIRKLALNSEYLNLNLSRVSLSKHLL